MSPPLSVFKRECFLHGMGVSRVDHLRRQAYRRLSQRVTLQETGRAPVDVTSVATPLIPFETFCE